MTCKLIVLDIIVKVRFVKVVNSYKTVLTTAAIAKRNKKIEKVIFFFKIKFKIINEKKNKPLSIWMIGNTVYRTKVISHTAKFFLKHQVKETSLEFAWAWIDGRVNGFLTTTRQYVIFERWNGSWIDWFLCSVDFKLF